MLNLIPKVKNIENNGGNFKYKSVYFEKTNIVKSYVLP